MEGRRDGGTKEEKKETRKERREGGRALFSLYLDLFMQRLFKIFNNGMAGHQPSRKVAVLG